jgi:hypothetical protein
MVASLTDLLPLPIRAEVAPGGDPGADPGTWPFTDAGVKWRQKAGITISNGRGDEDAQVTAGKTEVTFDDRAGKLSPRNVFGDWYGLIGTNTPMRIVYDGFDDRFDRTVASGWNPAPGPSGRTWSNGTSVGSGAGLFTIATVNNAAHLILSGGFGDDIEVHKVSSISAVATGAAWVDAIELRRDENGYYYRMHLEYGTGGVLSYKVDRIDSTGTTNIIATTSTGLTYSAGTKVHQKVRAIGTTLQLKIWLDSNPTEPDWQATVPDATKVCGTGLGLYEWRVAGNTNAGSMTISVYQFTVTISLCTQQVPEWPVRWPDKSGNDVVAPVEAAGILRYLGQNQPPLESAIAHQFSSRTPAAYWKFEDGEKASYPGSAVSGGSFGQVVDATFGNTDAPNGALSSVTLNTAGTSRISGLVTSWAGFPATGHTGVCFFKFPSIPASEVPFFEIRSTGKVTLWRMFAAATTFSLRGYDAGGTLVFDSGANLFTIDPTEWFSMGVIATESGSSVNWQWVWYQVGGAFFVDPSGSFTGTADSITGANVIAAVDGMLASHLWLGPNTLSLLDSTFVLVANGYDGEFASARVKRVFTDAGIDVNVHIGDSVVMGPQPKAATSLDVARDAETADQGVLYERGAVLGYIPHGARMGVPVTMALDWALGHIADTPEPTDDDQRIVNQWTSERDGGSTATVTDPESVARKRLYANGGTINVSSDQALADDAGWHVAVGTSDVMRWPQVTINLVAHPELIPLWLACRVGSRITIANLPKQQLAGEVADLLLEGWTQTITKYSWLVEMSLSPAGPYVQVGNYDDTDAFYDVDTSVVATGFNASATSIAVKAPLAYDTWDVAGGYVLKMNGEPISVTSATAPVLSSGFYTQTLTVTRGTLAKAHLAGELVRLYDPTRWGY